MIIGAHVSAAGGAYNAFINAQKIGAECFQIFGASPRQWNVRFPDDELLKKFRQAQKDTALGPIFLHALYLANIASVENARLWHASVKALIEHMKIADMLGARGLIFHIGSVGKNGDEQKGIRQVAKGVKEILAVVPGKTELILENSAGGGGKIGDTPEEIGEIMKICQSPRLKVCVDTQHAFAAGILDYTPSSIEEFVKRCDKAFGWKNVVVIHSNDSQTEFESLRDRHENIGQGKIGLAGFKHLAANKNFDALPWILEVPGFDQTGPDKKNIDILKKIRSTCG